MPSSPKPVPPLPPPDPTAHHPAGAAPAPDPVRPQLPPLKHGVRVPRNLRPQQVRGAQPLQLAEVHAVAMWFREIGSIRGTAKHLGIGLDTVRKYVNVGDASRGIPPLRLVAADDLPPLPPAWKQSGGMIPGAVPGAPVLAEEAPEAPPVVVALVPPVATPAPSVALAPPPPVAGKGPSGAADGSGATTPAPSPLGRPEGASPATGAPVVALAPAGKPQQGPVGVNHDLPTANGEVVRLSRSTRALFSLKVRTLAKLMDSFKGDLTAKDAPKLSKSQRDLLMVTREVRLTALDVRNLYVLERDVLGVGRGAGVLSPEGGSEDEPVGEKDPATLEELEAEMRGLLAANPNDAAPPTGGSPVTLSRSVLDHGNPPTGGPTPASTGTGWEAALRGK